MIITIDGPAASGKSTVARLLARRLDASFLDTGAMYRAVTLAAMCAGVDLNDEQKLLDITQTCDFQFSIKAGEMTVRINNTDVTEQIRSPEVTANARYIAAAPRVREKLVQMQRQVAADQHKIVTEGRDQGTVAFDDADVKFYLSADLAERARRRQAELRAKGEAGSLKQIQKAIKERDKSDEKRAVGPLKPAEDAIIVDTTNLSIEQVVEKLEGYVQENPKIKDQKSKLAESLRDDLVPAKRVPFHNFTFCALFFNFLEAKWFWLARWLCRVFCMLFFRVRSYGRDNVPKTGPFVLVSNHQSYLDPMLCGIPLKRRVGFLARESLFKNWFFGRLIASVGTIPMKLGEGDISAIRRAIDVLKQGRGICLFPEGTRTRDGRITPFKPGFGLLCRRGGAVVVPVVIDGAFECWPRHKKLFSRGSIVVSYGKAIPAEQAKKMGNEKLAEFLTETLRRMQNESRIKQGKKPYEY